MDLLRAALVDPGSSNDEMVELIAAYLNPADQVKAVRETLRRLAAPDAPADEPDLDSAAPIRRPDRGL